MKKTIFTLIITLLLTNNAILFANNKLFVYIKMNKQKYASNEKLILKICVRNNSEDSMIIKIFDKKIGHDMAYTTFQPIVYDMRGREAETIVSHRLINLKKDDLLKDLTARTIQLSPGEEIVHNVNLSKIYNLDFNKKYRVKGFFSPDFADKYIIRSRNELSFLLKKEKIKIKKDIIDFKEITPSEIIFLALSAEKIRNMDNMIKYYNTEKYIYSFPNFVKRYNVADDFNKNKIENEFISYLKRDRSDYILDFKIVKSDSVDKFAIVEAIVNRYSSYISERYKYFFKLEKSDNNKYWQIIKLDATVMKGIKQ
jgi:hypothetical protein